MAKHSATLLLVAALFAAKQLCSAVPAFSMGRVVTPNSEIGSDGSKFDLQVAAAEDFAGKRQRLHTRAVVFDTCSITAEEMQVLDSDNNVGSIVLLNRDASCSSALEAKLLSMHFKTSVTIVDSTDELQKLTTQSSSGVDGSYGDSHRITLHRDTSVRVGSAKVHNFEVSAGSVAEDSRRVLVVVPYGSTSLFPTKPVVGAAAAATVLGVEAVHSLVSTLANADLTRTLEPVFLFTTADNFNYKGLRAWLDEAPSTVLSSIDLAICVGDINPFQPLHMHISKPAKLDTVKALYNTITSTFADHGLAITTQRKKISLTATSLSWPHEALAKKGVLAVTLTTAAEPNNDWLKLTPAFGPAVAADDRLATVTRALADTLLALVFDEPKATLVVRALQQAAPALYAPDLTAMTAVMEHFRQYSVAPADAAARRGLESAVRQTLENVAGAVVKAKPYYFQFDNAEVYSAHNAALEISRGKTLMFDVVGFGVVLVWLAVLHVAIAGPAQSIASLMGSTHSKQK